MAELSMPAFLKSAEEEGERTGKTAQEVLAQDEQRYTDALQNAISRPPIGADSR